MIIDLDDDPVDTFSLQPEFMELAQKIRNESRNESYVISTGEELIVTVKWHPHPLMVNGKDEEWQYKIDKVNNPSICCHFPDLENFLQADSFRDLFEAVAEDAAVPSARVIMTYQSKRFFPSITPHTLRIWADIAEFGKNLSVPVVICRMLYL